MSTRRDLTKKYAREYSSASKKERGYLKRNPQRAINQAKHKLNSLGCDVTPTPTNPPATTHTDRSPKHAHTTTPVTRFSKKH